MKVAIGDRYGRLTVKRLIDDKRNPRAMCVCDCGETCTRQRGALVNGTAHSCGCKRQEVLQMNHETRALVKQAQALRKEPPDPTGLKDEVLAMSCSFHVKERCNHGNGYAVYDPTGTFVLAASACRPCRDYIIAAFARDPESAEAHERIAIAIAHTWEGLFVGGVVGRVV